MRVDTGDFSWFFMTQMTSLELHLLPLHVGMQIWFMHDGAVSHYSTPWASYIDGKKTPYFYCEFLDFLPVRIYSFHRGMVSYIINFSKTILLSEQLWHLHLTMSACTYRIFLASSYLNVYALVFFNWLWLFWGYNQSLADLYICLTLWA